MGEHFFWITSRSAGIVALLASSAAVALGLMMSMRPRKGQDLRVLHEALSLATQRWRKLHRFTALAWLLGVVHSIGIGTDAGALWFLVAAATLILPAGALRARRHVPAT
jgi:hypothetical protein